MENPADKTTRLAVSVFNYPSYVDFLADAYASKHAVDPTFSYESLARSSGLKSRTHARNIIKGALTPTSTQLRAMGLAFGLEEDELNYLLTLFKFRETKDQSVAFNLFQELMRHQAVRPNRENPFREIEIATSILHLSILSLVEFSDFKWDPTWIASVLKIPCTLAQIDTALNDLKEGGYVQKNPLTGRFETKQSYLKKLDHKPNYFLRKFHRECLNLAQDALENRPMDDRYLVGASIAINSRSYARIVQKVNAFIENLLRIEAQTGDHDTVIQLNAQLIRTAGAVDTPNKMLGNSPETLLDPIEKPTELSHRDDLDFLR